MPFGWPRGLYRLYAAGANALYDWHSSSYFQALHFPSATHPAVPLLFVVARLGLPIDERASMLRPFALPFAGGMLWRKRVWTGRDFYLPN